MTVGLFYFLFEPFSILLLFTVSGDPSGFSGLSVLALSS